MLPCVYTLVLLEFVYCCSAFHRVYTFSPALRADSSTGPHHLAEFRMVEAEMNFTQSLEDINVVSRNTVAVRLHSCPYTGFF